MIVFVTVFFNVWMGVCSLNVVFCECQCVESDAARVSVYVMWSNCLKCYSEIIKISAISIDTRYKPWNYGFVFRGVQGGGGMGLPRRRVEMIGYQLGYAIFQVSFQLMMHRVNHA